MQFISNGDFIFPFEAGFYWLKHFFVWSFQTGALNLDGIIRIPGRLLELSIFHLFGNMVASYFYLFFCFALVFISFYIFCRRFLDIRQQSISIIAALIVTFNPIFLGNTSKIGLVLAAGLLPLCLVCIKITFEKRQPFYLVGLIIALNLSFMHPFTMAVNALVSAIYSAYLAATNWPFIKQNVIRLVGIGLLAIAMHAYILLPIVQLGSVDKGVLSQDVSEAPIDYTALVDVANTGNLLTGLSLSKNAFKDYDFYNSDYQLIYFVSTLLLYLLLFGLFLHVEKRLSRGEKLTFVILSLAYLLLLLLSTGTVFNIDVIIKYLIGQPAGWIFRSPLKWQLYMPFFFFATLFLLLRRVSSARIRQVTVGSLLVIFAGASAYLVAQIHQRLLVPRTIHSFQALMDTHLEDARILFVNNEDCRAFAGENPALFTELNQILISKNVQLKHTAADGLSKVSLTGYDFVVSCQQSADEELGHNGLFKEHLSFVDGGIEVFKNQKPLAHFYTFTDLFELDSLHQISDKRAVAISLGHHFQYVIDLKKPLPQAPARLVNPFETLTAEHIQGNRITSTVSLRDTPTSFVLQAKDSPLYWQDKQGIIALQPMPAANFTKIPAHQSQHSKRQGSSGKSLTFSYTDPAFSYRNLLPNPSFEAGLWQQAVSDCNNYDRWPKLAMSHSKNDASHGRASLLLEAQRHIACTGPPESIRVEPSKRYIFSFDYKSAAGKAGYSIGFNNSNEANLGDVVRLKKGEAASGWHHFSTIITTPKAVTSLKLRVYGYPGLQEKNNQTLYDNFKFIAVPDIGDTAYMLQQEPLHNLQQPKSSQLTFVSPVEKQIHIDGARAPFYLAMNDTYNDKWQASTKAGHALDDHIKLNNDINAWYIDPQKLCSEANCQRQADGSYDLDLAIYFAPQRALFIGLIISAVGWLGAIGYMMHGFSRAKGGSRATSVARYRS